MRLKLLWLIGLVVSGQHDDDDFEEALLSSDDDAFKESLGGMGGPGKTMSFPPATSEYTHYKSKFVAPSALAGALVAETFQKPNAWQRLNSVQYKDNEWEHAILDEDMEDDYGMRMAEGMKYYGMAQPLARTWSPKSSNKLYGSLEVKFGDQHTCGGAYFKLFKSSDVANFDGATPYSIMFGPDSCGFTNSKVHFIIQKEIAPGAPREEFAVETVSLPTPWRGQVHQYGFELDKATQSYKIYIDGNVASEGTLVEKFTNGFKSPETIPDPEDVPPEDWTPPPAQIPDPEARKPEDWDETQPEYIPDTEAAMPEGWLLNEPLQVPNPDAVKPEDWNDEEDGEWIVPKIKNPKCTIGCGPWNPTKKNPLHKGPWSAPMIPNPDYTPTYPRREIPHPHPFDLSADPFSVVEAFNAIGFELWTVEAGTVVDNVFVGDNEEDYNKWISETWKLKEAVIDENRKRQDEASRKAAEQGDASKKTQSSALLYTSLGAAIGCAGYFMLRRRKQTVAAVEAASAAADKKDDKKTTPEKKTKSSETEKETEPSEAVAATETKAQERKKD